MRLKFRKTLITGKPGIGKMEMFSHRFIELVHDALNVGIPLLANVALKGSGLIAEIKHHPGVQLFEITRHNRHRLASQILRE